MVGQQLPVNVPLYVGQNLYLSCHTFTRAKWFKYHRELLYSVVTTYRSLIINDVKKAHGGVYECQGNDRNGFPIRAISKVYVGGK